MEFSKLDAQKMASIMLLDGCFIIHVMLKIYEMKKNAKVKASLNEKPKGKR